MCLRCRLMVPRDMHSESSTSDSVYGEYGDLSHRAVTDGEAPVHAAGKGPSWVRSRQQCLALLEQPDVTVHPDHFQTPAATFLIR